jgi:Tol biopolymer transport system component
VVTDGKNLAFVRSDNVNDSDPNDGIHVIGVDGQGRAHISRAARSLAWSPRGSTIAYAHASGGYVGSLDVATKRARRLRASGLPAAESVAWSPGGRFLAVATGKALFIVPAQGGVARKIIEARGARSVSWSPDGWCLAFSAMRNVARQGRTDLYVVSVRGGRAGG